MSEPKIPIANGPQEPNGEEADARETENAADGEGQPRQYPSRRRRMWDWITGRHGHTRDWLIAVFTAALTVATIFYVHYAKEQRDAMLKQVDRMTMAIEQTQALIEQQKEALEYARIQADVARQALQDARRSTIPVIQMGGWDFKPSGTINAGKITASITLTNRGSADVMNAINHIIMEVRKDEPPIDYRPNWKISNDVTIQRNYGERSFEVSRTFSQSEVEEIWAEHKFICVFGFLDYSDPLGSKIRKRFCVKFGSTSSGSTARECETWQGQEGYPK